MPCCGWLASWTWQSLRLDPSSFLCIPLHPMTQYWQNTTGKWRTRWTTQPYVNVSWTGSVTSSGGGGREGKCGTSKCCRVKKCCCEYFSSECLFHHLSCPGDTSCTCWERIDVAFSMGMNQRIYNHCLRCHCHLPPRRTWRDAVWRTCTRSRWRSTKKSMWVCLFFIFFCISFEGGED